MEFKSVKRQKRYDRHLTAKKKGIPDGACLHQSIQDVGVWPSGQPMQRVSYLHATKGLRSRLLPPVLYRG